MSAHRARRGWCFLLVALLAFVCEALWSSVGRGAVLAAESAVAVVVLVIVAYLRVDLGAPTSRASRIVVPVLGAGLLTLALAWPLRFFGATLPWAAGTAVAVVVIACILLARYERKTAPPAAPPTRKPLVAGSGWCRRWRVMVLLTVAYAAGRKG